MTPSKLNQTLQLAGGRTLGFAEYGSPEGSPILYFHGNPGSRLELTLFDSLDAVLTRQNLRMIAVDRPGIGLSDFQSRRRFIDWPADVAEFADKVLKLDRFNLMTYSAGGPFGAVCALKIPDRLERVTLISSPCPFNEPGALEGVGPAMYWKSAKIHPFLTGLILRMAVGSTRLPPPSRPAWPASIMSSSPRSTTSTPAFWRPLSKRAAAAARADRLTKPRCMSKIGAFPWKKSGRRSICGMAGRI